MLFFFSAAAFDHRVALAVALYVLPLSVIASSFLAHWSDGFFARVYYFCSTLWLGVGLLGMRRRVYNYDTALGLEPYHLIMTIAGFLIGLSVLIFFINIFITMKRGEIVTGNIWESRSPEWQVPSPMPIHNYEKEFEVVGEPYDYGLPGSRYVKFLGED